MRIEIESRHSDYGADAGGYSVLRIDGVWIGRIEGREAKEQVAKLIAKIAAQEVKFAALEWRPILEYYFPKVGDMVWWDGFGHADCAGPEIIHQTSGHNYKTNKAWKAAGYTHFRPINPPSEQV